MKRILITFLMFVFSMTSSYGEKLNYEFGIYEGEVENAEAHGYGIFIYTRGKNKGAKYVGEFKDNEFNGQGVFTDSDGTVFSGQFRNHRLNGFGSAIYPSGDVYVGQWLDDKYHGYGTFIWKESGDEYSGEYKNGEPWYGVRYLASGEVWGTVSDGELCEGCDVTSQNSAFATDLPSSTSNDGTWGGYPVSYASGSFHFNTLTGSAQGIKLSSDDGTVCMIKSASGGSHENLNIDKHIGIIGELIVEGVSCSNGSSILKVDTIKLKEVPLNQVAFAGEIDLETEFWTDKVLDQLSLGLLDIEGLEFRHEEVSFGIEGFEAINVNNGFIGKLEFSNAGLHVDPYHFRVDNWLSTNAPIGVAQSDFRSFRDNYTAIEGVLFSAPEFELELGRYHQPKPVVTKTRMLYEIDFRNIVLREGSVSPPEVRQLVDQLEQNQLVIDANLSVDSTTKDNDSDRMTEIGIGVTATPFFRISMGTLLSTPRYADSELSKFLKLMLVDSGSSEFKSSAAIMSVLTRFHKLTVRLENESLVEIAFRYLESYMGSTKEELLQTIQTVLQSLPGDSSIAAQLASALDRFLIETGTLIFSLRSEENISLFQMGDIIDKKGLIATELNPRFRFLPSQ